MGDHARACIFVGDDSLLIRCVELARQRGHVVRCIVTSAPGIAQWSQSVDIPTLDARSAYAEALAGASESADWLFSVANLRPVSAEVLRCARHGGINFHDGPLPRYGGVHAPAWAIMGDERVHGITWHRMTDRLDGGDILVQRSFPIEDDDTSFTLNLKCFEAGIDGFAALLDMLGTGAPTAQPHVLDRATYHRRSDRVPAAATLNWARDATEISAVVRALDFGGYRNTLGAAKALIADHLVIVREARMESGSNGARPGVAISVDPTGIVVATGNGALRLQSFTELDGAPIDITELAYRTGIRVGVALPALDAPQRDFLAALDRQTASHEQFWVERLRDLDPLEIPGMVALDQPAHSASAARSWRWLPAFVPAMSPAGDDVRRMSLAGVCAWLGHVAGRETFDVGLVARRETAEDAIMTKWFFETVPLRVSLSAIDVHGFAAELSDAIDTMARHGRPLRDLVARTPELRGSRTSLPVAVMLVESASDVAAPEECSLAFAIDARGGIRIGFDANTVNERALLGVEQQLEALLVSAGCGATVDRLSLLNEGARRGLAASMSGDPLILDDALTIGAVFASQVERTPDAIAIVAHDRAFTYRELGDKSDRVAAHLQKLGIVRDTPVGVYVHRSTDLIVAVLGVLKSGGAYLPLDPAYPAERLRYMIQDSETPVVLASAALAPRVPAGRVTVVTLDVAARATAALDGSRPSPQGPKATSLAYVIYTSGSTGTPKGVMVEHRNVLSFFAAMDRVLGTSPKSWLAVTSLSFDISVLELLWPLTHGSTVVIHGDHGPGVSAPPRVAFSLFYFSADENAEGAQKYRLLMEGAKFADRRGFSAVWTPERHFHAFGGLFPNPSVTSAAIAAITNRVAIRAGSVVLPLHHPLRIAEEWSVVDNLSNGRVGISFASGWRADDFVLRPEGYKDAKRKMMEGIDTVRRLWRGESLSFDGPEGKPIEVAIHPRPVQADLPVWVTAAGSPDTFTAAGAAGAGVLTHLLGQTLQELQEKIRIYREARRAAGHPGAGHVALMLHTFVGDDDETVKETVRGPMKEYLRTSVSLIEKNAHAFPTFRKRTDGSEPKLDFASLTSEEADALLEYSFERYYETSGLFGTVDRSAVLAERLASIGVDEVACLIDFGVESELVLQNLEHLDRVRARFEAPAMASIPDLMREHDITHMQCTPSQAALLLADPAARKCLPSLTTMLVGGEAMPAALARTLRELRVPRILNMYGPTETTIWSTCHDVAAADDVIPIGRPIANTSIRIVGIGGQLVPDGVPGELLIGGPGVTRGYLNRPELTAERFVGDDERLATGLMYRTGDQVRRNGRGELVFLGRGDHQVKVRGYRIELGEIERALGSQGGVSEAVVAVIGESTDDRRLVAYVSLRKPDPNASSSLRDALRASLPEFMIPSQVVVLDALPKTPNGKVDRRRLTSAGSSHMPASAPRVRAIPAAAPAALVATDRAAGGAATELERVIAAIWCDVLHVTDVAMGENFFDLGGHSLLAVQVHQRVRASLAREFPITDLFRYPTVRTLAAHLAGGDRPTERVPGRGVDRAALRKQALQRRQQPSE